MRLLGLPVDAPPLGRRARSTPGRLREAPHDRVGWRSLRSRGSVAALARLRDVCGRRRMTARDGTASIDDLLGYDEERPARRPGRNAVRPVLRNLLAGAVLTGL